MAIDGETIERIDAEAVNSKVQRELYAARKKIFPKRAYGTFRSLKWWVMGITLGIYYITPWLRWDRGEFAPDQAVLLDQHWTESKLRVIDNAGHAVTERGISDALVDCCKQMLEIIS